MSTSTCRVDNAGDQYWYADGGKTLHRDDGPAVIESDGYEEWRCNGVLHRIGGPAVTGSDGSQWWMQYGMLHREDGPAIILSGGEKEWFLNGVEVDPLAHFLRCGGNSG